MTRQNNSVISFHLKIKMFHFIEVKTANYKYSIEFLKILVKKHLYKQFAFKMTFLHY